MEDYNQTDTCSSGPLALSGVLNMAEVQIYSARLAALSNPIRLMMLNMIHQYGGEMCVCKFEQVFSLKQSTISHHLRQLREAGFVRTHRAGNWTHYHIIPEAFVRIKRLMDDFSQTTALIPASNISDIDVVQ